MWASHSSTRLWRRSWLCSQAHKQELQPATFRQKLPPWRCKCRCGRTSRSWSQRPSWQPPSGTSNRWWRPRCRAVARPSSRLALQRYRASLPQRLAVRGTMRRRRITGRRISPPPDQPKMRSSRLQSEWRQRGPQQPRLPQLRASCHLLPCLRRTNRRQRQCPRHNRRRHRHPLRWSGQVRLPSLLPDTVSRTTTQLRWRRPSVLQGLRGAPRQPTAWRGSERPPPPTRWHRPRDNLAGLRLPGHSRAGQGPLLLRCGAPARPRWQPSPVARPFEARGGRLSMACKLWASRRRW